MEVYFEHVLLRILGTFVLGTMFEHLSETLKTFFETNLGNKIFTIFLGCREILLINEWEKQNNIGRTCLGIWVGTLETNLRNRQTTLGRPLELIGIIWG